MQRRRSAPHTFEENIAAEKAKLEAQLAEIKPGPQMDALRKKIRQLETASHMKRVAFIARLAVPELEVRRTLSFQNVILKGDALRIVFLKPGFRSVLVGKYVDVVAVADLLARVDVD